MVADTWHVVLLVPIAFSVTAAVVPLARRLALALGITDDPKANRWHQAPTPYLGGVAIVLSAVVCAAFAPAWEAEAAVLLAAAVLVGIAGLIDDVRTLHPNARLLIEAGAASIVFFYGSRVNLFGDAGDFVLTVAWLVIITNSFNLLDNVDGAMGAIGTTIAFALTCAAVLEGQYLVGALAAVVAGACLGFLMHNWHPASIFMGDAGSLFLGFLLAAIGLKLRTAVDPGPSVVAVILLVGPALFDTTLVVISRVRARRPIYLGNTDHTSHRFLRLGLSHTATTLVLVAGTAYSCGFGVAVARGGVPAGLAVAATVVPASVALWLLLRVPVYPETDVSTFSGTRPAAAR
ncbi:MAG: UDP-GlcNAc:undecaprenyl-phosphate/decaprenyl-phosphate GlcNAc-phosphate transferase [Acidimicrobiaceae bacterium]